HALDDDRAGRVIGARFRAETQEADAARVDLVALDEPHHGRRGHRVDALLGTAHPEAAADDRPGFLPRLVRPPAPFLEVDPIGRHVHRESADPDLAFHSLFPEWPRSRRVQGLSAVLRTIGGSHGGDYMAAALESPS